MPEGIEATCLCGEVHLVLADREYEAVACHCSQCRRAQGSVMAVNMPVADADILAFDGIEWLSEFESSSGDFRAFCMRCGSPVYSRRADTSGVFRIRTGLLAPEARVRVTGHVFYDHRAPWDEGLEALPRHAGLPDGD